MAIRRQKGTYTDWKQALEVSAGYVELSQVIIPQNDPGPNQAIFYALQFGFIQGHGGYIGIQTDQSGKRAIFSIWKALNATGPEIARPFGGEGEGFQTIVEFDWKSGEAYRISVTMAECSAESTWWEGTILNTATGQTRQIGKIEVESQRQGINTVSVNFVEYYQYHGNQLPYSDVLFAPPTVNREARSVISPQNHLSTEGECAGSFSSIGEFVRHENGDR